MQTNNTIPSTTAPLYIPTGRALATMDGDSLDIVRVFRADSIGLATAENVDFHNLCGKMSALIGTDFPKNPFLVFFDLYDGAIAESVIRRIIRSCISYQANFVRTGNASLCRRMVLKDIEAFTGIDSSVISRATRNVRILTQAGSFTLNGSDASMDAPSLFDEGIMRTNGTPCGRKAVLLALRELVDKEGNGAAFTDEELSEALAIRGYKVSRRTVTKYRAILGIPKKYGRTPSRRELYRMRRAAG